VPTATDRLWTDAYRLAAAVARSTPDALVADLPALLGPAFAVTMPGRRRMILRHLRRARGGRFGMTDERRSIQRAFESYARYWVESFRLPDTSPAVIDRHMEVDGWDHIEKGRSAGRGVILALPHLGGWEWAGFWLTTCREVPTTVVVEEIEPPELFDWFTQLRRSLGMNVVPVGRRAAVEVSAALERNEVVCLLSDRDVSGTGMPVPFFGEVTTLPGGPAMLGMRTGAPVLPTAVYFRGRRDHLGLIGPPLALERRGRLRDDVHTATAVLASELEGLIQRAPEQWHLFQPNWPSDHEWLAKRQSYQRFFDWTDQR
jgi:phosphatidylinositol dimannoside acyltransferase